ncbi:enoyl-CoA hydratase/isomerase [Basidiobolus meristosporus CBS 931.73]|uniref:Enoyl-CoA hydratase/isomerase n=1 Tax=Basidiobolus meristosporus CBS 931.73 TaxID=1314790 RepID=A0A1Y1YWE9_9FUNG|nr:enoyl-CoA hydratase/isomerase [Basidiobolus meristosporus CBS 931.73]|eukprot:ORY02393.1 enoyl-CoA hydratase/isomerase [Basidiobolus meristosporus CBS 931.73]
MTESLVIIETKGPVTIVTINRPKVRNAVNGPTAALLYQAFLEFDKNEKSSVAILTGAGGNFCAGADLAVVGNTQELDAAGKTANPLSANFKDIAPMGPSRLRLSKPVIAAISGYAVAGGLELACWCDLRVIDDTAVFGVLCRLRGVPLIDGGTVRLPKLIGQSAAMDLILTGRTVSAKESLELRLANYKASVNQTALGKALEIAELLSSHPQKCMRGDRQSVYEADAEEEAMKREFEIGLGVLASEEFRERIAAFFAKSKM